MVKVVVSRIIDAPIAKVWVAVRDFGGVGWMPAVKEDKKQAPIEDGPSDRIGCIRQLFLEAGVLREQLLSLSDEHRTFSYRIVDGPIPVVNYVAHFQLIEVTESHNTLIVWSAEFGVAAPAPEADIIALIRDGVFKSCLAELNTQVSKN
jgi:hypothetical protein